MSDEKNHDIDAMQDTKRKRLIFSFIGTGLFMLLVVLLMFFIQFVQESREAARRMTCVPKQLALALHVYHDVYGTFPPAYTTDADGKPLHSWRVLILPYIEQKHLCDQIRIDEPWDSEYNSQFHDQMPHSYILYCPSRPEKEQAMGLTCRLMVIGPDTISNGPNCTKFSDITKRHEDTILFIEASVPVPWMKPEDLPQSVLQNGVVSSVPRRGQPVVQGIGSPHYRQEHVFEKRIVGANVAMVDGACTFFTADMSPEKLLEKSGIRKPE